MDIEYYTNFCLWRYCGWHTYLENNHTRRVEIQFNTTIKSI